MTVSSSFELDHADCLALLEHQTSVLELIAGGATLPEMLDAIAVALEQLIDGARCSILLLDPSGSRLRHGAAPSLPLAYSYAVDGVAIGPAVGSCGAAAYLAVPVVAEDIQSDYRWDGYQTLALTHDLRSCWSSPIFGRDGVVGTFAVYHRHRHRPDLREQRLVERFTRLASIAIDHAGMYEALRESEERFRRAFEDNAVGMALTDTGGRLLRVNRTLRDLLGRSEPDLLGEVLGEVLTSTGTGTIGQLEQPGTPAEPGHTTADLLACLMRGDVEILRFQAHASGAGGHRLLFVVVVTAVRAVDGTPVQMCLNMVDVTEKRAAERAQLALHDAEVARSAAEAASRAKSALVSTLSHEVRTPLQAITGFAELLDTLDLPVERRRAALGHIQAASSHILSLVDDVLDVARLEAGALPVEIGDVDVEPLVAKVMAVLQPLADEKQVTLDLDHLTGIIRADRRRLRQVLINVVTNGIRYNKTSGGRVEVRTAPEGSRLRITVSNTGSGIAPEKLERLFVPFDRLDADEGERGAGLGLVLARGLTEAMHGQLEVDSVVGVGTSVHVRLPAATALTAQPDPEPQPQTQPHRQPQPQPQPDCQPQPQPQPQPHRQPQPQPQPQPQLLPLPLLLPEPNLQP
ncbi:MAG TPA: ATP-binding protein [Acidimicrobiales bacterium]|jgi:signal transduction histidine kinase|nr:ATP-binding protein [Acidimicrobiales bacterium]